MLRRRTGELSVSWRRSANNRNEGKLPSTGAATQAKCFLGHILSPCSFKHIWLIIFCRLSNRSSTERVAANVESSSRDDIFFSILDRRSSMASGAFTLTSIVQMHVSRGKGRENEMIDCGQVKQQEREFLIPVSVNRFIRLPFASTPSSGTKLLHCEKKAGRKCVGARL